MAEKLKRKFLGLTKNEQAVVKTLVLVIAVVLLSAPFAQAVKQGAGIDRGYYSNTYTYGYGYSDKPPAAPSALSCEAANGICTWDAPTLTLGGTAISTGGGSIYYYLINYHTSALTECSGGTQTTAEAASLTKTLSSLTSGTTYYVAVCAVDNAANVGAAATTFFTAGTGSSSDGSGGGGGVSSAPATSNTGTISTPSVSSPSTSAPVANVDFASEAAAVTVTPASRDTASEKSFETRAKTVLGTSNPSIVNFVTYGTSSTMILGAGERLGVLNSYRAAYGKVPSTDAQWSDVIKIANGRWPSEVNAKAETRAKATFKSIYKHEANMSNANENAAVTVMAYGLRPANRNLNSEKQAILNFRGTFGRSPSLATDWDMVRAIAYSGAKR